LGRTSSLEVLSTRTGGFEVPRQEGVICDEETLLDDSIYTAERPPPDTDSTAETIKRSSRQALHTDDTQSRNSKYGVLLQTPWKSSSMSRTPPTTAATTPSTRNTDHDDEAPRRPSSSSGPRYCWVDSSSPTPTSPCTTPPQTRRSRGMSSGSESLLGLDLLSPSSSSYNLDASSSLLGLDLVSLGSQQTPNTNAPVRFEMVDEDMCPRRPIQTRSNGSHSSSSEQSPLRFEFTEGASKTQRQRKQHRRTSSEDSYCSSIHSFSFSQDDEGEGFEIDDDDDDAPPPPRDDECRDESSESSVEYGGLNMTDRDLMEEANSPGALRLTEEGLKRHERKSFQEVLHEEKPDDQLMVWKQQEVARKFYRHKHAEKNNAWLGQNNTSRIEATDSTQEEVSHHHDVVKRKSNNIVSALAAQFKKEDDVADFSLAPLNAMEHLNLREIIDNSKKKKKGFRLFGKKREASSTAQALLEKERRSAEEERRKRQLKAKQEKLRIEKKRQAYLSRQRALESNPSVPRPRMMSSSTGSSDRLTMVGSLDMVESSRPCTSSTADVSTLSSCRSSMPPCVVCHVADRTHIATPCMHFSFCEKCARKLQRSKKSACPVCFEPNVSFAAVSV